MELFGVLINELGLSLEEARNGTAFILQKAQDRLEQEEFEQLLTSIPELKELRKCRRGESYTEQEIRGMMGDLYTNLLLTYIQEKCGDVVKGKFEKAIVASVNTNLVA